MPAVHKGMLFNITASGGVAQVRPMSKADINTNTTEFTGYLVGSDNTLTDMHNKAGWTPAELNHAVDAYGTENR